MKYSTRMKRLDAKLYKARSAYLVAIVEIESLLSEITGLDDIVSSDFINDGLGLSSQNPRNTYMGLDKIIEVLEEKESFTKDDFEYYF